MAACVHRPCGQAFSGLTAFDRHLRWSKGPPWVSCLDPVQVGLVWSEARQSWATHIGPLSVATSGGIPDYQKQGMSPDRSNCKRPVAS